MAIYIKIIGNKESVMSDFIKNQKKYWFVTNDLFTGIRTIHYKTAEELHKQIEDVVNYLKDNKTEFKKSENGIKSKSEFVEIHDRHGI